MSIFNGSGTALITPFTDNGVNFEALKNLIEFQIANGTKALVICGTTGEPPTMTADEKRQVMQFAIQTVNHRIPVICGTGGNCTANVIESSAYAEKIGADAILAVTPYYNKCTQNGLIEYYKAISDNVTLPIIAYNVPSRTGVNILPETAAKLCGIKNLKAIKEASGNTEQLKKLFEAVGNKLDIYSGDDKLNLRTLELGGAGVISVVSNILPSAVSLICEEFFNGNMEKAAEMHNSLAEITDALFIEVNPIPVKTALNIMGYNCGKLRAPLTEMEEEHKKILISEMKNLKLI